MAEPPGIPQPSSQATSSPGEQSGLPREVAAALPAQIQELAGEAGVWGLEPESLAAAALALLANCLGNSRRVIAPGCQKPAPFSLIFVSDKPPGPSRWLELLASPWISAANKLEREYIAVGGAEAKKREKQAARECQEVGSLMTANYAELTMSQVTRLNAPMMKVEGVQPRRLADAISRSFDRAVVSLNSGLDPAGELLACRRQDIARLTGWLAASAKRLALDMGEIPMQGSLTLLWLSERTLMRRLLFGACAPWARSMPPVVLMRQSDEPKWFPNAGTAAFMAWAKLLESFVEIRCAVPHQLLWRLPSQSWPALEDFATGLGRLVEGLSDSRRAAVSWMAELGISIALTIELTRAPAQYQKLGPPVSLLSEESVRRAIVITRWLAQKQLETLDWIQKGVETEEGNATPDSSTDNVDIAALGGAILEKLAGKGPKKRWALSRLFHYLNPKARDEAIRRLIKAGKLVETEDKCLKVVA